MRYNGNMMKNTMTYDFLDGAGEVPAHQHSNGGGWVADSTRVVASAYIGPDAQVFGNARVYGTAEVFGTAKHLAAVYAVRVTNFF